MEEEENKKDGYPSKSALSKFSQEQANLGWARLNFFSTSSAMSAANWFDWRAQKESKSMACQEELIIYTSVEILYKSK